MTGQASTKGKGPLLAFLLTATQFGNFAFFGFGNSLLLLALPINKTQLIYWHRQKSIRVNAF